MYSHAIHAKGFDDDQLNSRLQRCCDASAHVSETQGQSIRPRPAGGDATLGHNVVQILKSSEHIQLRLVFHAYPGELKMPCKPHHDRV
jgi:hypothetical protein